jgi:hypothetical protein
MSDAKTEPLAVQECELLPRTYFVRRHAARVLSLWGFIVVSLATTGCGLLVPLWMQGKRTREYHSRLIADAVPLAELRRRTQLMEAENERNAEWCVVLESAKPDDSLLQTLAAIAKATQAAETGIEINSLEIQLPLEYPARYTQPPRWAAPQLSISATVSDGITARKWLERMSASDRIEDTASKLAPGSWDGGMLQVNAHPLTTRWLP